MERMKAKRYEKLIEAAAVASGVAMLSLPADRANQLRQVLAARFTNGPGSPLWEKLKASEGRYRPDGWTKACDFVSGRTVILFFDLAESATMWQFRSGTDLRLALADCPGVEFYLTDELGTFVLCHNHHDVLLGVGSCLEWLRSLPDC